MAHIDDITVENPTYYLIDKLVKALKTPPVSIPKGSFTEPTPAMPDEYKVPGNSIQSYHNYYIGAKSHMFSWKKRRPPEWINTHV